MAPEPRDVVHFEGPVAFRRWLAKHHAKLDELWVGFHKKRTGTPSLTWPESVDEALCYGWIDGIRKRIDDDRYTIRFTPRRPGSIWSAVNRRRMRELIDEGRVSKAGLAAWERRREDDLRYSYEQQGSKLDPELEKRFRSDRKAWKYYAAQPPGYRRTSAWWVMSAKRQETRERRLAQLVACSAEGRRIPQLARDPR